MLKYIFFDIGYTLVNEDRVWEQRCKEQAEMADAKAIGLTAETIYQEILEATLRNQPQFKTVIKKYQLSEPAPYCHEWEALYDDTIPVLAELAKRYSLGIIANQTDGLQDRLKGWGIDKFFSIVISSWNYQITKPDKRIFQIALKRANCTPQEALMVGDRLDNDIYPAKALGFQTVWIKQGFGGLQTPVSQAYQADYEISSLSELPALPICAMGF